MKISPQLRSADAKEMRRQGELAFTMVEIAISIGVIGFALVAIIGILPAGMSVQKDNREDTVISQDAPYFLDAIRNGAPVNGIFNTIGYAPARALDFLTNYVQQIRIDNVYDGVTNSSNIFNSFGSGAEIIGILSAPQTNFNSPFFSSNYFITSATVRALSGPATAQQGNGLSSFMAFTYRMEVFISPFNSFAPDSTNWNNPNYPQNSGDYNIRRNRWLAATSGGLTYNLFDVRLRFSWPVFQNGSVGPGRQTYRTLVSSPMTSVNISPSGAPATNWWFFQPQTYTNRPPPGL